VDADRTDEDLMLAYASGDEPSFRELFKRYAPMLIRVLTRHVGRPADAQDLAQQAFLHLHRSRADFKAGMKLRPWILTIALNLARDLLRRRGRRPETPIEVVVETLAAPVPEPPATEVQGRVRAALATLPAGEREVIELHWFEEMSFQDIAAVVGSSSGAVRVRASRGYARLRQILVGCNIPDA
jgi:RNA polymerase sigma-70 factor (ECF subfamily)